MDIFRLQMRTNPCSFDEYHFYPFFTVLSLLRKFKQQLRDTMSERRPNLLTGLNKMQDFYMELKWDFHSWCK